MRCARRCGLLLPPPRSRHGRRRSRSHRRKSWLLVPDRRRSNKVPTMFHVKTFRRNARHSTVARTPRREVQRHFSFVVSHSLSDAKIPENDVENILHIHPARQPPQRPGSQPKFLGGEL